MSEETAARCSYHEYQVRLKGKEKAVRHQWEMNRWLAWQLLSPYYKPGRGPKTAQAFCRFPWEKSTEEEAMAAYRRTRMSAEEAQWLDKLFSTENNG